MKTKSFLVGLTFFFIGMVVTLGVGANLRHNHYSHQVGVRKAAIIEVGAPLTVAELKHLGII